MINKWIKKISQSQFGVSVLKVGSGQLIAQLFSIVSIPILSRIYNDTAYGDTALITSTAAILISCATFGLNSAVMKPKDDEEAKTVFTTAFWANLIICTGFTSFCIILIRWVRLFDVSESYCSALFLMWGYSVLTSTSSLLTVYVNRKGKYNRLFFNPIIGAAANFIVAIPLGLLGFGYIGFMLTNIIQSLVVCIHMMWHDSPFKKNYRISEFKRVFIEYKDYVLFQYPSNFIGNVGIEYPTQYLGRTFTTQELGGYSMCIRLMKYPIRLIAAPISTVYFRTATEYHRKGQNLAGFTYKMIFNILLISAIPVAAFIFISEPLFAFVLGESWREAGRLASVLIIQYVFLFCSQTTSFCLVSIGKQRTGLMVSVIRLIVAVIFCAVGYVLFGTMTATVYCCSVGQCLFNIYEIAVNFYCMDKKFLKKYLTLSIFYAVFMFVLVVIKAVIA